MKSSIQTQNYVGADRLPAKYEHPSLPEILESAGFWKPQLTELFQILDAYLEAPNFRLPLDFYSGLATKSKNLINQMRRHPQWQFINSSQAHESRLRRFDHSYEKIFKWLRRGALLDDAPGPSITEIMARVGNAETNVKNYISVYFDSLAWVIKRISFYVHSSHQNALNEEKRYNCLVYYSSAQRAKIASNPILSEDWVRYHNHLWTLDNWEGLVKIFRHYGTERSSLPLVEMLRFHRDLITHMSQMSWSYYLRSEIELRATPKNHLSSVQNANEEQKERIEKAKEIFKKNADQEPLRIATVSLGQANIVSQELALLTKLVYSSNSYTTLRFEEAKDLEKN